jgi:hypothetical protein
VDRRHQARDRGRLAGNRQDRDGKQHILPGDQLDVANNEMTVGAGVKIGDVIQPLYDAGKAVRA